MGRPGALNEKKIIVTKFFIFPNLLIFHGLTWSSQEKFFIFLLKITKNSNIFI